MTKYRTVFTNEMGNRMSISSRKNKKGHITYVIMGPDSRCSNTITQEEARHLINALKGFVDE